jgi:hypothetical protein
MFLIIFSLLTSVLSQPSIGGINQTIYSITSTRTMTSTPTRINNGVIGYPGTTGGVISGSTNISAYNQTNNQTNNITITSTPTLTPTHTPSQTATHTPSQTATQTPTETSTSTQTYTTTQTTTQSSTFSDTTTPTYAQMYTVSNTPTTTPSPTSVSTVSSTSNSTLTPISSDRLSNLNANSSVNSLIVSTTSLIGIVIGCVGIIVFGGLMVYYCKNKTKSIHSPMSSTMPEKTPSIPIQQNPISVPVQQNLQSVNPVQTVWTQHTDGVDTWYVSSSGESSWTLPQT